MTDLGPANAYQASAVAINNFGQVIGVSFSNSDSAGELFFTDGRMTTLPVPARVSAVSTFAINDNGEIVGSVFFASSAPVDAAKYGNGVWTDLGGIVGASSNKATEINISGQNVEPLSSPRHNTLPQSQESTCHFLRGRTA
jgi:uncharacterized membrane protein